MKSILSLEISRKRNERENNKKYRILFIAIIT